jgi:hypothetical protein
MSLEARGNSVGARNSLELLSFAWNCRIILAPPIGAIAIDGWVLTCPREGLTGEPRPSAKQVIEERAEAEGPDCQRQHGCQKDRFNHVCRKTESGGNQQCDG